MKDINLQTSSDEESRNTIKKKVKQTIYQGMKLTFFAFRQPGGDFEKSFRPDGFLSARMKYVYTKLHKATFSFFP